VVLPGAKATNFWNASGSALGNLPTEIVMSTEDLVDASLAGLDAGEFVTIPALPDAGQGRTYEAARQAMRPNLSHSEPAARYRSLARRREHEMLRIHKDSDGCVGERCKLGSKRPTAPMSISRCITSAKQKRT